MCCACSTFPCPGFHSLEFNTSIGVYIKQRHIKECELCTRWSCTYLCYRVCCLCLCCLALGLTSSVCTALLCMLVLSHHHPLGSRGGGVCVCVSQLESKVKAGGFLSPFRGRFLAGGLFFFFFLGLGQQFPHFRFHYGLSRPKISCSIPHFYFYSINLDQFDQVL